VGEVQVGARHPVVYDYEPQVSTNVVDLLAVAPDEVNVIEGSSVSIQVNLTNPSTVPLTGLTATTSGLPNGVTFTSEFPLSTIDSE
jgi:hypothetical protein